MKTLDRSKYNPLQLEKMDTPVKMEVVRFVTDRPKAGRRGSPAIPEGTELFGLRYDRGGFFTYAYTTREAALRVIESGRLHKTDNLFYYEWNVIRNVQDALHCSK
jgi:hypothetical protein